MRRAQFVLASLQPYILTTLHYYVFIFPLRHFGLSQSSKCKMAGAGGDALPAYSCYFFMLFYLFPDFVIAYPKKYKSYNFSRQECKKQGFSRIGGRACYFTRLFARLPKQQKQPLIIKHLQTYFEKVTKSGS